MSLASPYGRGAPEGGGEGIVIFLKKITSPQAIMTHFPENQKNSNIFLIALSVTPYGVPALPKGEPSRLCCKLKNNLSFLHKKLPPVGGDGRLGLFSVLQMSGAYHRGFGVGGFPRDGLLLFLLHILTSF